MAIRLALTGRRRRCCISVRLARFPFRLPLFFCPSPECNTQGYESETESASLASRASAKEGI